MGNWVGTRDFTYRKAAYELILNGFSVSSMDQYTKMMTVVKEDLQRIGKIATTQNLAFNLLYWMAYLNIYSVDFPMATNFSAIGKGQLQYFQMTGKPSKVFNLNYQAVGFAGAAGYILYLPIFCYPRINPFFDRTVFVQ